MTWKGCILFAFLLYSRSTTGQQDENSRILTQFCSPDTISLRTVDAFKSLCTRQSDPASCCNVVFNKIRQQPNGSLCSTPQGFVFISGPCFNTQLRTGQDDDPAPRPDPTIHFPKDSHNNFQAPVSKPVLPQTPEPASSRQDYADIPFGGDFNNRVRVPVGNVPPKLGRPVALEQNTFSRPQQNSFTANAPQAAVSKDEDDDNENIPVVKNSAGYQATNFALNLFKNIGRSAGQDSVISPLLPQLLLSNLVDYASPKARNQVMSVVHLYPTQLTTLTDSLSKASRSSVNTIESATANFIASDLHLNKSYKEESRLRNVEVFSVDFNKPNQVARSINKWVSDKTHQLINELINPGSVNTYTRLLLANSIFFKGKWKYSFIESKPGVFETAPNSGRQMNKMFQLNKLRYGEMQFHDGNGLRWVELPYEGDSLAMMVFLPTQKHQLEASVRQMTTDKLAQAMANLQASYINTKVHLHMPKFTLTDSVSMVPALQRMGISSIFRDSDALQYLTAESTVVSDLTQKSFISVDEIGTKATSVASLSIVTLSITPQYRDVRFDVDEPFMVMIVDKQAQFPMFIGQIYDPRE